MTLKMVPIISSQYGLFISKSNSKKKKCLFLSIPCKKIVLHIIGSDCVYVSLWTNYYKLGSTILWLNESPDLPWGTWNENGEDDFERKSRFSNQRRINWGGGVKIFVLRSQVKCNIWISQHFLVHINKTPFGISSLLPSQPNEQVQKVYCSERWFNNFIFPKTIFPINL